MSENALPLDPKNSDNSKSPNVLKIGRNIIQERFFFFLLLALLLVLTLILIWPNLIAILTAFALVVIIKPIYNWFLEKKWIAGSANRATAVTLITFLLLIALPIITFMWLAYNQANDLVADSLTDETMSVSAITEGLESFLQALEADESSINREEILNSLQESIAEFTSWVTDVLIGLAGWLIQFFTSVVIVLVIMMVLLPRFKTPEQDQMASIIPFPPDITNLYLDKIQLMIMAMFKGTFFLAILQGAAMGVVFLIAGVPYAFLLTILSMFLALLPMIGISLIAWPIGIILILNGQVWQGIFVIVAFLIIVANIDTALRPVLVPKAAYLNPALVMLSVFGGLSLLGIIGLIYGPVIMILLVTSLEVYTKYIMRSDLDPFLTEDGSLDLEKLGLRDADEDDTGGIANAVQRVVHLVSRRDSKEGDSGEGDAD